jgi:hypothetical protein
MRSQVQVLAGPPAIVAGQSAVGSKPGALAGCLGRAGAARPSPPASPSARPGPSTHAAGATTTTHRGRPPSPARQPHRRCSHLALPPTPLPSRSRQPRALPTPAWPAWSGSGQAPLPPCTARSGSAADPADPRATAAASSASRPPSADPRAARRRGRPPRPRPVPVVQGAPPHRPSPTATAWGGRDGRVRTDGVDTRGLDAGRVDTVRPDRRSPGRPHQVTGHRMGWTPNGLDSRAPDDGTRMGGHLAWGRGPATDATAGVLGLSTTATTPDRWMPAGRRVGEQQPRTAQQQGLRGAPRFKDRPATAATVSRWVAPPVAKPRLGALLSSE